MRPCSEAQEEGGDVLLRSSERETAAGHHVENFRRARNFDHDGAKRGADQGIGRSLDRIVRMRRADQQDLRRIDAEFEKSRGGQFAEFDRREILPYPENLLFAGHARRKTGGESGGGGFAIGGGIDFVQRAAFQTAFESRVSRREAQRDARIADQRFQTGAGKSGAKACEFFRRAGHAGSRGAP